MKGLKIILWICAISFLLGFIYAALPWPVITKIYHWAGIQPPTAEPTTVFILRLFLATVGMMGLFFVILARNPLNYGAMLIFAAYWLIAFGIFYLVGSIPYGLPVWYYSQKVIFSVVLGVLILIFRKKAIRASTT
ncbi:MAG: hypothetical protein OS130_01235 [Thermodesulfobacteriota bacterium]|jgi:hypothetical protein|nr:MAG: hypothetical protein OS130_01235 [Thermodesulfobacteriota bacterium]